MVHFGESETVLARCRLVLDAAYQAHPERLVRRPLKLLLLPSEVWIDGPDPPGQKTEGGGQ